MITKKLISKEIQTATRPLGAEALAIVQGTIFLI